MSATLAELERLYLGRFQEYLRVATALTGSVESGREAVHDGFVNAVRSRSQETLLRPVLGMFLKASTSSWATTACSRATRANGERFREQTSSGRS